MVDDSSGHPRGHLGDETGRQLLPPPGTTFNKATTAEILDILFIWDFDRTLLLDDSDYASVHSLDPSLIASHLHNRALVDEHGWVPVMNLAFGQLFDRGHDAVDILSATVLHTTLPIHTARAIRAVAATPGAQNAIVSDSNTLFIHACLKRAGLSSAQHFRAGIFTNVAATKSERRMDGSEGERLVVTPYTQAVGCPHGCSSCPHNLCKSDVVRSILDCHAHDVHRIVYVGDGSNDFCPVLTISRRMRSDVVLYRKGFPLERALRERSDEVQHSLAIHGWDSPEELERLLDTALQGHKQNNSKTRTT